MFMKNRAAYGYGFSFDDPHYFPERLEKIGKLKEVVFVCCMADLFGEWVNRNG